MKTFEATMLKEISRMATKYMDLSEKLEKQLTELKLELLLAKKRLEERDRGWEAYCNEIEDKMRDEANDMMAEMINDTNREDLL